MNPEVSANDSDAARLLRLHLAECDAACPVCAAPLGGHDGDRCPSCGSGLVLRIGSVEVRLGWWITMIVGLGMAMGWVLFGSVVGAFTLLWEVVNPAPWPAQTGWGLVLPLLGVLALNGALGGLLWLAIKQRRRFLRRPVGWQIVLALLDGNLARLRTPLQELNGFRKLM